MFRSALQWPRHLHRDRHGRYMHNAGFILTHVCIQRTLPPHCTINNDHNTFLDILQMTMVRPTASDDRAYEVSKL